jgi:hypothetical protein
LVVIAFPFDAIPCAPKCSHSIAAPLGADWKNCMLVLNTKTKPGKGPVHKNCDTADADPVENTPTSIIATRLSSPVAVIERFMMFQLLLCLILDIDVRSE